jgi:hypothetical protein
MLNRIGAAFEARAANASSQFHWLTDGVAAMGGLVH